VNWCDDRGITTDLEAENPSRHLCDDIRESCGKNLKVLKISPYRVCGALFFDGSDWKRLQRCTVDQMDFKGCSAKETKRKFDQVVDKMTIKTLRWPLEISVGMLTSAKILKSFLFYVS
jgi:hypothetical protein